METRSQGRPFRVLLVDHRDSFTFNLVHLLRGLGAEVRVRDSRAVSPQDVDGSGALLLGPGPHGPTDVQESIDLVRRYLGTIPILGVCLGLQILGVALGGRVRKATRTAHGVVSRIEHGGTGLFRGLPNPARFVRYHSLVLVEPLPPGFTVTARDDDGDVAALAHGTIPLWGVQFHPESVLSEGGASLLENFLRLAKRGD